MASTTAWVLVGSTHPNDGDICPTHLVRLIEGDRAGWVLHDLNGGRTIRRTVAESDTILRDLLALLAARVLRHRPTDPRLRQTDVRLSAVGSHAIEDLAGHVTNRRLALSITVAPGSSLQARLADLMAIADLDITVNQQIWSRQWSPWSGTWVTTEA